MGYLIKIFLTSIASLLTISSVSAVISNVSVSSSTSLITNSFLHDTHYMPAEYVYVFILIGLGCLAASRIYESAEDILSIGAVIPLAMSAWFANYMTFERNGFAVTATGTSIVNTQIITPNIYLSITMVVFTILAILNLIWIFYLKNADKKTESTL